MKIAKILIGVTILLLLIGAVAAFEIKDLKPLDGYKEFDVNGYSNYTTNNNRYILVEKISALDDDFKDEWFSNHTDYKFTAYPVGDNIWYDEDRNFNFYGYEEVVNDGGDYYMVSINQNSKLSPGEMKLYLQDLKDFNKLNNLKPVEI